MDPNRHACLDAMGIDVWVRRVGAQDDPIIEPVETEVEIKTEPVAPKRSAISLLKVTEPVTPQPDQNIPTTTREISDDGWDVLQRRVAGCTQCDLAQSRTQTVFGVGDQKADWLIIGEAPGAEEDRQGEPFVGRAGQLLTGMLKAIGLKRDQVYIANILKCRPPNNRDPQANEVEQCEAYLQRQIALLQPRIILCVGRIAAHNLLKTTTPLSRLRGRPHVYGQQGIPVIVTYHPAYLLRTPLDKRKAWDDLLMAQSLISQEQT